jgi:hypothetical protein
MPRFTKQADCITSAALAAFAAGTLSPLARLAADPHLRACDFCAAELRLHERAAPAQAVTTMPAPPLPLALRLFAESKLAESAAVVRRAA